MSLLNIPQAHNKKPPLYTEVSLVELRGFEPLTF
jgi:hypothetical protein